MCTKHMQLDRLGPGLDATRVIAAIVLSAGLATLLFG